MDNLDFIQFFALPCPLLLSDLYPAIFLQKTPNYVIIKLSKIMKIKISKEKLKKELKLEQEKEKENKSFFSIFSSILIIILIIGIIIELVIIINLNNKINKLKENINNIPNLEYVYEENKLPDLYTIDFKDVF